MKLVIQSERKPIQNTLYFYSWISLSMDQQYFCLVWMKTQLVSILCLVLPYYISTEVILQILLFSDMNNYIADNCETSFLSPSGGGFRYFSWIIALYFPCPHSKLLLILWASKATCDHLGVNSLKWEILLVSINRLCKSK